MVALEAPLAAASQAAESWVVAFDQAAEQQVVAFEVVAEASVVAANQAAERQVIAGHQQVAANNSDSSSSPCLDSICHSLESKTANFHNNCNSFSRTIPI